VPSSFNTPLFNERADGLIIERDQRRVFVELDVCLGGLVLLQACQADSHR
jgi:hypothetical protein